MPETLPDTTPLLNETKFIDAIALSPCDIRVRPDDTVHLLVELPNVHLVTLPIPVSDRPLPFLIVPAIVDTEQVMLKPQVMSLIVIAPSSPRSSLCRQ